MKFRIRILIPLVMILPLCGSTKLYSQSATISFDRKQEPREKAFTLLVPSGWLMEGGIFRVDPTAQGGAAQSIAAKCDFAVKSDNAGTSMIRWLPDMLYFDMRSSMAAPMFPQGSNYNGMTVLNKMYPADFIHQVVIPYSHQHISGLQIIERKEIPKLAKIYQDYANGLSPMLTMTYYAEMLTISYTEGGRKYLEKIVCVIEDWGQLGVGLWGNKQTFYIRTPYDEFEDMSSIFSVIQNSVEFSTQWLVGEIKGQMIRSEIMTKTIKNINEIDDQIVKHQQKTNAEIHNDMYLVLNDKEEYVNPYTNKVEIGSNQWQNRWINESGGVIYTDMDDFNPNHDPNFNNFSYKKSPIRKR